MKPGKPGDRKPSEGGRPKEPREDFGERVKAHVRYRLPDILGPDGKVLTKGANVPGVTTVLRVLDSGEGMIIWANQLGLDGINSGKFRDESAKVGTLAHYLVERDLDGQEPELKEWSEDQQERAAHSVRVYKAWRRGHPVVPILVEHPLVSVEYGFGGTIDFYGTVEDEPGMAEPGLVDYKTSKGVYLEHKCQLAAYVKLLLEHGYLVKTARIIRLGRTEGASIEEHIIGQDELRIYWRIFQAALQIYNLKKELKAA